MVSQATAPPHLAAPRGKRRSRSEHASTPPGGRVKPQIRNSRIRRRVRAWDIRVRAGLWRAMELQKLSFIFRNAAKTSRLDASAAAPMVLRIALSCGRRNGFVASSSPIVVGTVGFFARRRTEMSKPRLLQHIIGSG
eukprot:scaffold11885_cov129-Isochrysis_galbana.AAC.3